jgi:hypothetical protein
MANARRVQYNKNETKCKDTEPDNNEHNPDQEIKQGAINTVNHRDTVKFNRVGPIEQKGEVVNKALNR